MALSTRCGHCDGIRWEIKEISPLGGNFKQNVVQCASCGVPIGVMDFFNLGTILKSQEKQLQLIIDHLSRVTHAIQDLERRMSRFG